MKAAPSQLIVFPFFARIPRVYAAGRGPARAGVARRGGAGGRLVRVPGRPRPPALRGRHRRGAGGGPHEILERALASGKPAIVNVITDNKARAQTVRFSAYTT